MTYTTNTIGTSIILYARILLYIKNENLNGVNIVNLASQGLYTSARATAKTLVDTGHVTHKK
jgi:hypothetical protein